RSMPDAQPRAGPHQRGPEEKRILLQKGQYPALRQVSDVKTPVPETRSFTIEQLFRAEFLSESAELARGGGALIEIHHVDFHAPLLEEAESFLGIAALS